MKNKIENPLSDQLAEQYTPIRKFGKWIILTKNNNPFLFCVCDGFFTYWGLVYPHNYKWAVDYPERIPQTVKNWIYNIYIKKYILSTIKQSKYTYTQA